MGQVRAVAGRGVVRRRLSSPVCQAPFGSMYFDQFGGVRACCANNGHRLGDVTTQSLRDIWTGAAAAGLRRAMRAGDLSHGCDLCSWQLEQGGQATMARTFDRLDPPRWRVRPWPEEMQFSLSNACNLQCVMCSGDNSSAIRAHREHLPPLPRVYGDEFMRQLGDFVPHLRMAAFLGGEPLIGAESLEVMRLIAARNPDVAMRVTTNGTVWSRHHQEIFDASPFDITVSIDGFTQETFEAIRVGADFDAVMGNLERFAVQAARSQTLVGITHCLMVQNWHEFGDLLEMAERRGLGCYINTVVFPVEHALVQLPRERLREVVEGLRDRERRLSLVRLRPLWDEQVDVLRHRLRQLEADPTATVTDPWGGRQPVEPGSAVSIRPRVSVPLGRRAAPATDVGP